MNCQRKHYHKWTISWNCSMLLWSKLLERKSTTKLEDSQNSSMLKTKLKLINTDFWHGQVMKLPQKIACKEFSSTLNHAQNLFNRILFYNCISTSVMTIIQKTKFLEITILQIQKFQEKLWLQCTTQRATKLMEWQTSSVLWPISFMIKSKEEKFQCQSISTKPTDTILLTNNPYFMSIKEMVESTFHLNFAMKQVFHKTLHKINSRWEISKSTESPLQIREERE